MGASESKLAFKEDIFRLAGEDNIAPDSQLWARFSQLPESAEDVQALWSPNDLRAITRNTAADRPPAHTKEPPKKNVETLLYRVIGRLRRLKTERCYEDAHLPIGPEVLNCLRILTRVLPYIYEADHLTEWEDEFFWKPRKPAWVWDNKSDKRSRLYDGLDESKRIADEREDDKLGPPLGEELIDILLDYLFFPGFTLPPRKDANGLPLLKSTPIVWQSGIGANKSASMTKDNEKNAVEVLRVLIALCSRAMYITPNIVAETDIRPLTYMTTRSDRQVVLILLCSLLNTIFKYKHSSWTNFDLTGESRLSIVTPCLQFVLALITYTAPDGAANEFRRQLGRLHRPEDFQFMVEGLRQILMEPALGVARPVRILTASTQPLAPDTLALFWELLQANKRFRSYLSDTGRANDFVVLVLYYAVEAKDDPAKQGIVRMCVFILQTLSVDGKFSKSLNQPFGAQETLPTVLQLPKFHGSYADFLVGHVHAFLTRTNPGLESLHPALLAIINNIAPYLQGLQRATCGKLMELFDQLSSPAFLLANESNQAQLSSLLDAVNGVLEHQYNENRRFVEIIVKNRKRFEALRDFTIEGALAEIDRLAMERKDRASGELAGVRSPVRGASLDSPRGPPSARSPSLGNVPEHSAFAIADDDDDNENGDSENRIMSPASASTSIMDDTVPSQLRSMSEKARGKQPVGQGNFSRSTSRNTSNTSLPALAIPQTGVQSMRQSFSPTPEWLHSWLPHLPLHTILQTTRERASTNPRPDTEPAEIKVQTFRWTPLALGWYLSLLWGFVYASDAGSNKGTNGIWTNTHIKLFNVLAQKHEISLRSPKGAVDAVGNTIAQRISNLSFSSPTVKEV